MNHPSLAELADLSGRLALVTGAARGFGSAIANRLAEAASLGTDDSIAALLDEAEDVVNQAGREIMADLEKEKRRFGGRLRRSVRRRGRDRGGLD